MRELIFGNNIVSKDVNPFVKKENDNDGILLNNLEKLGIKFKKEYTEEELKNMEIKDDVEDVKELEDFCKKNGIILGSFGKMKAKDILKLIKKDKYNE